MDVPIPARRPAAADYPQVEVRSRAELRAWLEAHHATSSGAWIVSFKKHVGEAHVTAAAVCEACLCFGWIDSVPRKLDADRTMLLCTPRKAARGWSRVNKDRVARLEAAGLLAPAGVRAVEAARASGTWTALDAVEELVEPDDLTAALDADPAARRFYDAFPRSAKRGILEWIGAAKRPETRAARIAETARLAAVNERANAWKRKG